MAPLPLLHADQSLLLIVDMQSGSAQTCAPASWRATRDRAIALARAAGSLGLPVIATRQQGLEGGDIDPELARALPPHAVCLDKTQFAAPADEAIAQALAMAGREQVVVCGMAAHVAVVQTVSELVAASYRPFAITDAICATDTSDTEAARARMRAAGTPLLSAESALCEWLRDAAHPLFQQLLAERT